MAPAPWTDVEECGENSERDSELKNMFFYVYKSTGLILGFIRAILWQKLWSPDMKA